MEGNSNDPNQNNESVDWEAKYKEAIQHSREWETRAKSNKNAADELAQLKADAADSAKRTAALEAELTAMKNARQQDAWKAAAAEKYGVPTDLLVGDDEESINAWAEKVGAFVKAKPSAPAVHNPAGTPNQNQPSVDASAYEDIRTALFGPRKS